MSHELEIIRTIDGEQVVSFAAQGARDDVWHQLGQYLGDRLMTAREAMASANMDREIRIVPMMLPDGTEWGVAEQKMVVLDGKIGITPDGKFFEIPSKVVGIHGAGGADAHQSLSIGSRFEYAEMAQTVTKGEAVWSTAGLLRNGTQGFAAMEANPFVLDPSGIADTIRQYMVVTWSFDGSRATELATSQVRVVCANTLAMHDSQKSKVIKVKHTSAKAEERLAQVAMQHAALKDREAFLKLKAERMLAIPRGRSILRSFVENVMFPVDADASKRATTIREQRIDEVEALWYAPTNSPAVGDNGWAVYNTVTEYLDWYSDVRTKDGDTDAARLRNQFDGSYDAVKSQVADYVLSFA